MTDLTKLSDDELMTALGQSQAAPAGVAAMSDADLLKALGQPASGATPVAEKPISAPGGVSALSASTLGVRQGLTFNFGDEIMAGLTTPIEMAVGAWTGKDAGKGIIDRVSDAYSRGLEQERALQKQAQTQSPVAYGVGNVAGGMVTSGQMMKGGATLLKGGGSMGSLVGRGAAEGALYGAAAGAGEGEGANDRIARVLQGGTIGGLAGGALGAAGSALAGRNSRAAIPSVEELRAAKDAAYKAADDAGVVFTPAATNRLNQRVTAALTDIGFDPALQPGAVPVLKRIQDLAGQNITLSGLDTVRKVANNGFIPGNKSNNAAVARIVEALDSVATNPAPAEVLMGDAAGAASSLTEARRLASQVFKQEKVADAVTRAERQAASTGSGGNADNATRQKLRALLERGRGFSDEEKAALETAIRGTPVQNGLRLAGKLAPQGNGLMMMLQGGGAVASGGATIPLAVAGAGAKMLADRATAGNVRVLDALIRSGGSMPARQLTAGQRLVLEALTRQAGPIAQ